MRQKVAVGNHITKYWGQRRLLMAGARGNGKFLVLSREAFCSVEEAKVIVENWRLEYNNHRPHSGLAYMTPAAFAASCNPPGSATLRLPDCKAKNVDNSLTRLVHKSGSDHFTLHKPSLYYPPKISA